MKRTSLESSQRFATSAIKVRLAVHRKIAVQAVAVQAALCVKQDAEEAGTGRIAACDSVCAATCIADRTQLTLPSRLDQL